MDTHEVDVVVIGAGQAGLASAHELERRGVVGYARNTLPGAPARTFVVLDAERGPGGAWRHRWPGLTMESVNHIADLPGLKAPAATGTERASDFVVSYFDDYETAFELPILRPVKVKAVRVDDDGASSGSGLTGGAPESADAPQSGAASQTGAAPRFLLETSAGNFRARAIINCTGTWRRPFVPWYPGMDEFRGIQLHTGNYRDADRLWRKRVLVVGGGISAIDHLWEVSRVTKKLYWATRTPPRWAGAERFEMGIDAAGADSVPGAGTAAPGASASPDSADVEASSSSLLTGTPLSAEAGRAIEQQVRERTAKGLPPLPVVAVTGLPRSKKARAVEKRVKRRPMFDRLDHHGAWWGDDYLELDAIIWATGFRADLRHLTPLHIHTPAGGVLMDGTHVRAFPNLHLIGYGASSSTIGARRDARIAVREVLRFLNDDDAVASA